MSTQDRPIKTGMERRRRRELDPALVRGAFATFLMGGPAIVPTGFLLAKGVADDVNSARLSTWLISTSVLGTALFAIGIIGKVVQKLERLCINVGTVVIGALLLHYGLLHVMVPAPPGRIDVALSYQLWIVGIGITTVTVEHTLSRVFIVGPVVMTSATLATIVLGKTEVPGLMAMGFGAYLCILIACHISQRRVAERASALVAELAAANDALARDALHDPLTGIANRRQILDSLQADLAQLGDGTDHVAVLFLDLDGFKAVNDTFGHAIGDALLVQAAERIESQLDARALLGRQGGDEFIVVLRSSSRDPIAVAERIRIAVGSPFQVDGHELSISTSIGVAICAHRGLRADDLIREADTALYRAKKQGRNRVVTCAKPASSSVLQSTMQAEPLQLAH
jgi:diguanylate cyclase (GGDEF)-like protein